MNATRKLSALQEAYRRAKPARDHLRSLGGRCMESTEDKCGILWERWCFVGNMSCRNVYLYATPHGWDLSLTADTSNDVEATLAAVTVHIKAA
jgi:hypothetical protein